jgi:hypothetical protein
MQNDSEQFFLEREDLSMKVDIERSWLLIIAMGLASCVTVQPTSNDSGGEAPQGDGGTSGDSSWMERGVDRGGSDYRDFDLERADPALCQAACAEDSRCEAYTYVKPGLQAESARCWLKDRVPEATEADCCVSGVKP